MHLAAASPPDGYMFMLTSTAYGHLLNKKDAKGIEYSKSYEPVALIGLGDSVLTVHPTLPVKNVKELIALAKKNPGQLNYSSSGIGGFPHMNTELFKLMTGTDIVHVPFQGGGPAAADTMAGNTQMNLGSVPSLMGYIRSGRLKALGVGATKRNPQLPDVPTITEAGYAGADFITWNGVHTRAGTPKSVVAKLNAELNRLLKLSDVQERMLALGLDPAGGTPEAFGIFVRQDIARWAKVIKEANVRVD